MSVGYILTEPLIFRLITKNNCWKFSPGTISNLIHNNTYFQELWTMNRQHSIKSLHTPLKIRTSINPCGSFYVNPPQTIYTLFIYLHVFFVTNHYLANHYLLRDLNSSFMYRIIVCVCVYLSACICITSATILHICVRDISEYLLTHFMIHTY